MATLQEDITAIGTAARSGRLDEAAVRAATAIVAHPADPVLNALAGAVEFHRGQFAQAARYLATAHRLSPQDITVRANLAESLYRTGDHAGALALCTPETARADRSLRLARLGGALAQEAGRMAEAVEFYRLVVAQTPDDWVTLNNLGNALADAGDPAGAVDALQRALRLAPDSPPIHVNLGNALIADGKVNDAEIVLRDAANRFADDPTPLVSLHGLYLAAGYEAAAYDAMSDAALRAPADPVIQCDFGYEAQRAARWDLAEAAYRRALEGDPALASAYVGLASVFERVNRESELDALKAEALAAGIGEASIAFIDALRFKRANAYDQAFAALDRAGDVVAPARAAHLRGTMLDRLGRHDEAFAAFTDMNRLWAEDPSDPRKRAALYRDGIVHGTSLLGQGWTEGWTAPAPPGNEPVPVFLLGFPRSGTTLLDTMLMADPRVVVLEEEPFIGLAELEAGGIDALATMDEAQQRAARQLYYDRVRKLATVNPDTVIIDKHPMHLNKVPVIRRLFPQARFLLALRHPADALLSCFITNFRLNNAMSNFLDLQDAATTYDLTFTYWQKAREVFDLPVATVVYERLVEDTARELRPVFDWLGLDWPGEELDHTRAARARGTVTTASYSQVTEPVYTRAAGRWHRYAHHLEPVFDRLRPWVDRFGYSLEDGRIPAWPGLEEVAAAP